MENICLRYFWMCSERRTVLSSMQHDFFLLNFELNVAELRHHIIN